MCGFIGIFENSRDEGIEQRIVHAMAKIKHRGPDDSGTYTDRQRGYCVGHVRLSIIDTSDAARQPMVSADGRYVLVYNGEIYNFAYLCKKHCADIESVNRKSDTSVLLHLFIKYGPACLNLLDGMFAFAVFDKCDRTVFLARDRFGEKPLYWSQSDRGFVFGSEVQAVRGLISDRVPQLNGEAICAYHSMGSIPAPLTVYTNINALEPGCWFEYSEREVKRGIYWSIGDALNKGDRDGFMSRADVISRTSELLVSASRSRLVSDVPVGLFLSGGLDSGALASLCGRGNSMLQTALCLDFEESRYSEFGLARETAERFNLDLVSSLSREDDFVDSLGAFFSAMDQPTTDGYNTYFVSKAAKETGIKVWLSGVGGDEFFGGYPSFERMPRLHLASQVGQNFIPEFIIDYACTRLWRNLRMSRVLHLFDKGPAWLRAYQVCRNVIPLRNVNAILAAARTKSACRYESLDRLYPELPTLGDPMQITSMLEAAVYMRSQLLRDMDNFSMAHSIELRSPFLDHNLFEFLLTLPQTFKYSQARKKALLIDSLPSPLPERVVRQPKRGFTFPVEEWIRKGLEASFADVVFDSKNQDIWDLELLKKMWQAFKRNEIPWGVMWTFYAFARWREQH